MKFLDYGKDDVEYEHTNITILDGNFTNIPLLITEIDFGAIDAKKTSCHGYYIIRFSSYLYRLQ